MVLVWALAAVDVLCAISLASLALGMPLPLLQAASAAMLMVKGVLFIDDIVSIMDIILAIVMFALIWIPSPVLALAIAIYLGIKAMASFA
jgi:hypothetical protein